MTQDHPHRKWWTLAAMCFGLFMIMLDNTVVNVALPTIQQDLDATPAVLEWTVNAYVLSFATLILLGGKLGDRYGRRRMFIVGLAIFTAFSLACGFAETDVQLVVFRALQGVGAALLNPLSLSIITSAFPRRQLPMAIGVWAGISGLGLAVGPVLGGVLVDGLSWGWVFFINVPIGIAAAAMTLYGVDESRNPRSRSLDLVGTVLVTAGLFSLVWGLIETNTHAWLGPYTLSFLGLAVVLLGAFIVWEHRSREPMLPLRFFRNRAFTSASVVVTLVGLALFGSIYFITLYFQNVQGYSAVEAGLRSLPMTVMVMIVAPVAGRLNARVGARVLMVAGMAAATLGMLGLTRLGVDTAYGYIAVCQVVLGAGISLTMPSVASAGMAAVDPRESGIAAGVINASRQVGGALGIAMLGSIGAKLTLDAWHARIAALPAGAQAPLERLDDLVIGARESVIARVAGPDARDAALEAYMSGFQGAMWTGAVLCALAGVAAAVLMPRHARAVPHGDEPAVAVEA